ncbi:polyamine aminopropyltransferase [Nocardiopsis lambiniae]|uniref:Spermidine synthase n=1 Tax=Nocardiopsis lambiniae TaxID=3075539 RepID=A0ABU2M4T6_9ACTN|nr:spermidine synthase [Nocardiopsis sp. DSM 44743]MDT0327021.1 spermidine synthase [Nocardiopsis sp. DSM 44743]
MSARFQELDWRATPMGELSLRRRYDPLFQKEVHEIKLDDDFLMSSLFTAAEIELARLALAELEGRDGLRVAVGGLGLGYTAQAVLENPDVGALVVVEALSEVIEWHRGGLLPVGAALVADSRCRLEHGDFFALVGAGSGTAPQVGAEPFDALIVDIDHSPSHLLHPAHAGLYTADGLRRLSEDLLVPGGVFALWSNDAPDEDFVRLLAEVFAEARAEVVHFPNPLQGRDASNTVYVAVS